MVEVGIEPIAAHMFVLYFGMMSMITPPIALAAFAAASIAEADPMKTGMAAVKFGWAAYVVPFLFVFSPALILIGSPTEVVLTVVTAAIGVWLVSAALAGYFMSRLSAGSRVLFATAGLLALVPAGAFSGAIYTDAVGVLAGLVLMAHSLHASRRRAATGTAG